MYTKDTTAGKICKDSKSLIRCSNEAVPPSSFSMKSSWSMLGRMLLYRTYGSVAAMNTPTVADLGGSRVPYTVSQYLIRSVASEEEELELVVFDLLSLMALVASGLEVIVWLDFFVVSGFFHGCWFRCWRLSGL